MDNFVKLTLTLFRAPKIVIHLHKAVKYRTSIGFKLSDLNVKVPSLWKYANLTKLPLKEGKEE